ncbi:MAG TPA: GTPase [Desulfobacterales bacterium]|nr:GTPase [Desulfobacterales bacterium]
MNRPANEKEAAVLKGIGRIERLVADVELLKDSLEAVPLWRPATALAAQCAETVRMIRAIAARFDRRAVVTVIGPSGSGKSTLVNALAGGRELSPAGRQRPTTGRLLVLGAGPDAEELAHELGRDSVEMLPASGTALPEGLCLVDTPDTDSMEFRRHLPALERAVAHADVLVCVFDAENPKRRDHADFLAPIVRRFDGESLAAVINKCDRLDEAELTDEILPDFRAYLGRGWQRPVDRVLCTSGRRHVQDPAWDAAAEPRHGFDEFDELRALVFGLAGGGRVVDRRVENARQLHRVMLEEAARELAADRDEVRSGLEAFAQARSQALAAAAGALREADPRRGGGWGAAFYASLAARWVGPVGWLLALWTRAASLGSGLAAMLRWARPFEARRSRPPAENRPGDGREGIEAALRGYRAALISAWPGVSEPLVRARLAPSVRGIEAPLEASEETVERLAEVWDDAVRGETERVARRLGGGWLQLLFNAPVVGVLGTVGWTTVGRFFSGDYLPGDYFTHAFWVVAIALLLSFCALQLVIRLAGSERVIGRAFAAAQQALPALDAAAPHPLAAQLRRLLVLAEAAPKG